MATVNKDNFGYLGLDFQYKLIKIFINEPDYFVDFNQFINQNAFTDPYLKTIVGVMKDYFHKHEIVPSYDMIMIELRSKARTEDDVQYYTETLGKIKKASTEGIDEISHLAENFFKQQEMIKVANKVKEIAGSGNLDRFDECNQMWENISNIKRRDSARRRTLQGKTRNHYRFNGIWQDVNDDMLRRKCRHNEKSGQ